MYQPYRWRVRRRRFVALAKYPVVFVLGVVVTLGTLPYLSPSAVDRVNAINQALNETAADLVPAISGKAINLPRGNEAQFDFKSGSELLSLLDPDYKPPVEAIATAQAGDFRKFTLSRGRGTEIIWLNQVGKWEGTGDDDIRFKAPDSPYVLMWEIESDSELGSVFDIWWTPSIGLENGEYALAMNFGLPGIGVSVSGGNNYIVHDNGTAKFAVRASGVSWTLIAATEP
ncbi:MAG: hypothetical protein IH884_03550 [Myxococcales bacterium]|nr:hypothetical protein [Myxococcales bacterium]